MPMDGRQKVGLGCGTLILIALIVLIFGNMAVDSVRDGIEELDAKIQVLDHRTEGLELLISKQTGEIEELQALIEDLRGDLRGVEQESGTH